MRFLYYYVPLSSVYCNMGIIALLFITFNDFSRYIFPPRMFLARIQFLWFSIITPKHHIAVACANNVNKSHIAKVFFAYNMFAIFIYLENISILCVAKLLPRLLAECVSSFFSPLSGHLIEMISIPRVIVLRYLLPACILDCCTCSLDGLFSRMQRDRFSPRDI